MLLWDRVFCGAASIIIMAADKKERDRDVQRTDVVSGCGTKFKKVTAISIARARCERANARETKKRTKQEDGQE
jgi:hypothetical protein